MNRLGEKSVAASSGRFRLPRRLHATAVAVCAVAVFAGLASAQGVKLTDSQRKALMVYNFAKYTEWPKSAFADDNAPFVIGVLGKDPFGKDIDIIKGKSIKGRTLVVTYFSTAEEVTECHLLFISSSEMQNLPRILKRLENSSILTAAEAPGFIDRDGIINLVPDRKPNGTETVEFEVNLLAAVKANLKLDTQLLKLARRIKS
jgi:hypothetical protein